jgi:type III secretion protein J
MKTLSLQSLSGAGLRWFFAVLLAGALAACSGNVELLSEIAETEANDVLAALLEAGIKTQKHPGKDGKVNLVIEESEVSKAIAILHAQGLPRERFAKMGDVFHKEGLISSPLEERVRYLWALSQELSGTVSQIDGVLAARVHVVLPERGTAGEPAMPSSAAVFIKFRTGYRLDDSIPQVRRLVANSIPGLIEDKVSVVLLPSMPKPPGDPAQTTPATVKVFGLSVGTSSATGLRIILAGILVALLIAFCGAGYLAWRTWGPKKIVEERAPASMDDAEPAE